MSQVSVTINGRQFRMACEDGQEEHLMKLARELDARIGGLRAKFGEIGDTRLTVMAAITVADELAEAGTRVKRWRRSLPPCRTPGRRYPIATKPRRLPSPPRSAAAAERIEGITKKLNQTIGTSGVALG